MARISGYRIFLLSKQMSKQERSLIKKDGRKTKRQNFINLSAVFWNRGVDCPWIVNDTLQTYLQVFRLMAKPQEITFKRLFIFSRCRTRCNAPTSMQIKVSQDYLSAGFLASLQTFWVTGWLTGKPLSGSWFLPALLPSPSIWTLQQHLFVLPWRAQFLLWELIQAIAFQILAHEGTDWGTTSTDRKHAQPFFHEHTLTTSDALYSSCHV